jgi:hypothetical protein
MKPKIRSPLYTTQTFIVNCHLVQHVFALIKAITRYYNLKTPRRKILVFKHPVKNKMRYYSLQNYFQTLAIYIFLAKFLIQYLATLEHKSFWKRGILI